MKYKNMEEIKEKGITSYYKVIDPENGDTIGRYSDLRESKKDVNDYIDECDGECLIDAFKLEKIEGYMKIVERYIYQYGKFVKVEY